MGNLSLLVIVSSAPYHYELREAIRMTWGKDVNNLHAIYGNNFNGRLIFQVGLDLNSRVDDSVMKEHATFGKLVTSGI